MGSFYTNVLVQGATQDQIAEDLRGVGREAYVSPTVGRFTVVYDALSECQDHGLLAHFAGQLSRRLGATAMASLMHDDDVLMYWLFQDGELVDEYSSAPGYFEDADGEATPPSGGDARRLCLTFGAEGAADEVERVLRAFGETDFYVFETDRHHELIRLLGLPAFAADFGFDYIARGETPHGLKQGDLVRTL